MLDLALLSYLCFVVMQFFSFKFSFILMFGCVDNTCGFSFDGLKYKHSLVIPCKKTSRVQEVRNPTKSG